jgi:hypothetical protein
MMTVLPAHSRISFHYEWEAVVGRTVNVCMLLAITENVRIMAYDFFLIRIVTKNWTKLEYKKGSW